MSKLDKFYDELEKLRKPKSDDPYDSRITHCILIHNYKDKDHSFEVRGWRPIKDGLLNISVVNWTMCAGTASLILEEDNVDGFSIRKDS